MGSFPLGRGGQMQEDNDSTVTKIVLVDVVIFWGRGTSFSFLEVTSGLGYVRGIRVWQPIQQILCT